MKFSLTKEQRQTIFDGGAPHIRGEGECPVERGDIYRLSPKLAVRVSKVNFDKGDWWIRYVIEDKRHKVRSLKRTPNDHLDYDKVRDLHAPENFQWDRLPEGESDKDLAKISEESAYTGGGAGVVDDAGEGVEPELLEKWAKKAQPVGERMRATKIAGNHDEFSTRLKKAKAEIESFDPGNDPHLQKRKRKALRTLTEKEAA